MLDNFSKEIVYMKMLPPYTQTLFVELIRFTPGQPDGLYSNGHSHRHSGTPTMGRQAIAAGPSPHSRHVPHTPVQASPLNGFSSDRPINLASQHLPPPPPWSRWSTMTVPPASSTQSQVPTQPSPRKRKFVDATPAGVAAESSAAAKRPKPQTPKPQTPKSQTPKPQTPKPQTPSSAPSPRPSQIVSSPSLAKVLAPNDSQLPLRSSTSMVMPLNQASPSSPSRTSTPVRSVKLVISKKPGT